jgi:hypothetical protein
MKLEYLQTSQVGLRWLRTYFRNNPELDFRKFLGSLRRAEAHLKEFPGAGEAFEDRDNVREYHIAGSVFSLLYTVARDTVWVIDVRDARGYRSAEALQHFNRELKERFGIS